MPLTAGQKLGPYEIVSPIGQGGMGEVYRARDTRLERSVALKVLTDTMSGSEEVRQRFEREAKAISSLQHPNICTLYDVGREGETDFLVMELLEGESLAQRIEKGPLPIEEVLKLGLQIADALERAHASGIVHRDLKPGNVFVTERGVKLLDFGLAKLHATGAPTSKSLMGQLPTEYQSAPLTSAGMILGTFQYMAPEQLEGKEADARSDLFALGCVLYEMATGKKAFSGTSQASLIGAIMSGTPPAVSSIAPLSPPALDRVIATCLAKDPKDRWHTAHDVKLQLAWIAEGGSQIGLPAPVAIHRKNRERLAWIAAAVAALAAVALGIGYASRAPRPERVARFEITTPAALLVVGEPKLSPDGNHVAFVGVDQQSEGRIWVRSLDSLQARPIAGTEGVSIARSRPFWSPDSRWLAFMAEGKLKRVPLDGGPSQKVCDAPTGADGSWSESGLILFDGSTSDPIRACDATGGVARTHVASVEGDNGYVVGWPQFLPGGDKFLFVRFQGKDEENGIWIANADGKDAKLVVGGLSRVEYAPPGYLVFVRESTLVAQRFDAGAGKLSGEPIPIVDGIGVDSNGQAEFSVSRAGVLVYRAGAASSSEYLWLDLKGNRVDGALAEGELGAFDLSKDGRWLAYQLGSGTDADVWVRDLKRGVSSRFTFEKSGEGTPLFTPDGSRILFSRFVEGEPVRLVSRALDRTGADTTVFALTDATERVGAAAFAPDGKTLFVTIRKKGEWGIYRVVPGGSAAEPVVVSEITNSQPQLSPDGRWLAFISFESEPTQIYVVGVGGASGRWQVSTKGGFDPAWAPDGKALYYMSVDNQMMRVPVTTGATFDAGVPEPLFVTALAPLQIRNRSRLSPDGQRFLVLVPAGRGAASPMTAVLGWNAALGR